MEEDRTNALQVAEKGQLETEREHAQSMDSVPTAVDGQIEETGKTEVLPVGYVDQSCVLPRKELAMVFVA